jgi:hypothetical protein
MSRTSREDSGIRQNLPQAAGKLLVVVAKEAKRKNHQFCELHEKPRRPGTTIHSYAHLLVAAHLESQHCS